MMNEQRFETGKAPHVVVNNCGGALVVGSWKGTAVLGKGPDFSANEPSPDQLELTSSASLTLTVPEKASLTVKSCTGPLTIKHIDGFVSIGTAHQPITLNDGFFCRGGPDILLGMSAPQLHYVVMIRCMDFSSKHGRSSSDW